MIFGWLYERKIIKSGDLLFKLWCWLAFQKWYQISLIPYHIAAGLYYGYEPREIYKFCKMIITVKGGDGMRAYVGETGLAKTFQGGFEKEIKCPHCEETAKIMFVVKEEKPGKNQERAEQVVDLHKTTGEKGGLWVHDNIACANYLCPHCFKVTAIMNQA